MIKEAVGTGETIEEAKENALVLLGADINTDIDFEVIDTPKKKTLGLFGGNPAKVRVFTEIPDPKPEVKPVSQAKPAAPKPAKPAQKPAAKAAKAPAEKTESAAPSAPVVAEKAAVEPVKKEEIVFVPESEISADSQAGRALAYLKKVLSAMEVNNISYSVGKIEGGYQINLEGEGLGVVIGRRGETLDALQYLVSLAANNGENYTRVVLDTGNYREKREQTLQSLAARVSNQVIRTGRSRSLEPMNPYERRIIHTAVQKIDGVNSNSVGDGTGRRVVISPVGNRRPGGRPGFNNNREGFRNERRPANPRNSRPQSTEVPSATRAPKSDVDGSQLYGKINLNK